MKFNTTKTQTVTSKMGSKLNSDGGSIGAQKLIAPPKKLQAFHLYFYYRAIVLNGKVLLGYMFSYLVFLLCKALQIVCCLSLFEGKR